MNVGIYISPRRTIAGVIEHLNFIIAQVPLFG
jgi:hypothetical protein